MELFLNFDEFYINFKILVIIKTNNIPVTTVDSPSAREINPEYVTRTADIITFCFTNYT